MKITLELRLGSRRWSWSWSGKREDGEFKRTERTGNTKATCLTSLESVWKAAYIEASKYLTIKEAQQKAWDDVEVTAMEMFGKERRV